MVTEPDFLFYVFPDPGPPGHHGPMRQYLSKSVAALVLSGAMLLAAAGPAFAPRSWGLPNLLAPCNDGRTFNGSLSLTRFDNRSGVLVARGSVAGTCGTEDNAIPVDAEFVAPVTLQNASCDSIDVLLGDISVPVRDGNVTLDLQNASRPQGTSVLLDNPTGDGRLRGQLCATARIVDQGSLSKIVASLNRVLLALASIE